MLAVFVIFFIHVRQHIVQNPPNLFHNSYSPRKPRIQSLRFLHVTFSIICNLDGSIIIFDKNTFCNFFIWIALCLILNKDKITFSLSVINLNPFQCYPLLLYLSNFQLTLLVAIEYKYASPQITIPITWIKSISSAFFKTAFINKNSVVYKQYVTFI